VSVGSVKMQTAKPIWSYSENMQGRSDGVYIGIYPPQKNQYLTNFYLVTGCFFSLWPTTNSISCQCAP